MSSTRVGGPCLMGIKTAPEPMECHCLSWTPSKWVCNDQSILRWETDGALFCLRLWKNHCATQSKDDEQRSPTEAMIISDFCWVCFQCRSIWGMWKLDFDPALIYSILHRTIALRLCLALSNSTFQTAAFSTVGTNVGCITQQLVDESKQSPPVWGKLSIAH